MRLLDTNAVSEWLKPQPDAGWMAWSARQSPGSFYLSAVSVAELWQGVECLPAGLKKRQLAQALAELLATVFGHRVLAFDAAAAVMLGRLMAERRRAGRPLGWADAQIAATARTQGLALVTRNVGDFEGCGLELINPWTGGRPA